MRGKEVFLDRCVGCHGLKGDGKGPGARFLSPPPADFTDKDDACCGGDTGPGDFYYRILRGWPGTAMENFGDRLSRRRHLARRPLHEDDPERHARSRTCPRAERLHRLAAVGGAPRLAEEPAEARRTTSRSRKRQATDPFMQEAMRVFPGLAPGDSFLINDGNTPLSLAGRGRRDQGDLPRTCSTGRGATRAARGEQAARPSRRRRSRRPCRGSNETAPDLVGLVAFARARAAGGRRSRTTSPRRDQSQLGHGRLDDGHVLRLLRASRSSRSSRRGRSGHFHELDTHGVDPALRARRRTTTRPSGRWTRRSGADGDAERRARRRRRRSTTTTCTPTTRPTGATATWHVGLGLARLAVGLRGRRSSLILILWVWQYRTTLSAATAAIYPVDSFGGYTTELAGPATLFFLAPHRRS